MALSVLLGGARSGKSTLAVRCGAAYAGPVCFIATATAGDEEMATRIARHRAERPPAWQTVEEPLQLEAALARADEDALVLVDCLTLWVANQLAAGANDGDIAEHAARAAERAAGRAAPVVAVSNEVGMGIVPADPLARRFRDIHGRVNATWVAHAAQAHLVVAGALLGLAAPDPGRLSDPHAPAIGDPHAPPIGDPHAPPVGGAR